MENVIILPPPHTLDQFTFWTRLEALYKRSEQHKG